MALEDVIGGALAEAREAGVLESAEAEEVAPVEGEETAEEESTEESGEESAEEKAGEAEAEGEEEAETVVEVTDDKKKPKDAKDTHEDILGPAKDKRGNENRIPHSRVGDMIEKGFVKLVTPLVEGIAEDLGLDKTKISATTLREAVKSTLGDVSVLRERVSSMDELEPIMIHDADNFVRLLAHSNPAYRKFLTVLDGGEVERKAAPSAEDDPMPEADAEFDLGNGQKGKTYSVEGHKKLMEWLRRDVTREVETKYEKRLKPIEDERSATERTVAEQREIATQLKDLLDEAKTWDGFEENQEAIRAAWRKIDKKVPMSRALRQAYQEVVVKKLKDDALNARQKALDELKKAPKSTSTPSGGAQPKKKDNTARGEGGEVVGGTEAAIRNSLASARAAGIIK